MYLPQPATVTEGSTSVTSPPAHTDQPDLNHLETTTENDAVDSESSKFQDVSAALSWLESQHEELKSAHSQLQSQYEQCVADSERLRHVNETHMDQSLRLLFLEEQLQSQQRFHQEEQDLLVREMQQKKQDLLECQLRLDDSQAELTK